MYDASTLIKIGKSIDIPDNPDFNELDKKVSEVIYNGGKITYPWFYEKDSSDRFHLLDQDKTINLYFDNFNRDDLEGGMSSLVDYLDTLENQMKVIKNYIDHISNKYEEFKNVQKSHDPLENINPILSILLGIDKSSKIDEIYYDALILSIAKFFLSDETHDKYKTVFHGSSKKNIFGPAISREAYDSVNQELFGFFDEHGLEKQGYVSFLNFFGDIFFSEPDSKNISIDSMSKSLDNTFNEMYSDFFNNQKTITAKYNSMLDLKGRIRFDIKHMSNILEKLVCLDFLSEIYDTIEMQKSSIDNIKSFESGLSGIESDLEPVRDSMISFAGKFEALHPYEVYALCYLISKHDDIQSYGTLDEFRVHRNFKKGQSTENEIYYNAVKKLFRKIPKNKKKGSKIISDIQLLIESEPEYRVHKIQEELLLENISTIKGEVAGMKKGIGSMNGSLSKAIEYMRKQEIDTAIFDPDKPDRKLNLSELVGLQEFLKAE
ncbi:hypothetical protein GQ472_05895 [archaeon]|nr:hypothetical protein [archaeon]